MVWIPKPVLELKMEGNADDSSGYDNHGTVTDAVLTEDKWGHSNSAYSLNGTSAFIDCGNDESLNITGANSDFSICIWFKARSQAFTSSLVQKGTGTNSRPFQLFIHDTNNYILFQQYDGVNNPYARTTGTYTDNQWHHVVGVRDATNSLMKIYIDGQDATAVSNNVAFDVDFNDNGDMTFAKKSLGMSSFFKGIINEVHIYSVALTPTQVKYLYDKTKRNYGGLP